jgi:hypothetical protein
MVYMLKSSVFVSSFSSYMLLTFNKCLLCLLVVIEIMQSFLRSNRSTIFKYIMLHL